MATTLTTNKKDYLPGETVTLTLGGFDPGASFQFAVRDSASDPGDDGVANVYSPFWVTDGGWGDRDGLVNGQIVAQWVVPSDPDGAGPQVAPALNATLEVTASSASTSGTGGVVVASTTFTDAGPNPPPVQLYYVPEPEDQLLQALQSIETGGPSTAPSSPVTNYISIAISGSGTIIYYDQGENGYVNDIANPTAAEIYNAATNPGGVQIWGNGIASDGVAPGYASDLLSAGNVIVLQSTVPVPTPGANFYFDGGDKIGVTKSVAVTRTGWAEGPDTLLAGSVEVLDTSKWGTEYRVPVGVDVSGGASKFQYTGLFIMAGEQGATISVDRNADGDFTDVGVDLLNVSLTEGQSQLVDGSVNVGARVVSDKPVQVVMLTGDIESNYESRDSSLLPTSLWTNSYYTPVSTLLDPPGTITTSGTQVWLYNPGASAITVNYEWRVGSGAIATGSVSVPGSATAGGYNSVALPANVGAHFFTTGATPPNFYAFSTTDATGTSDNNQAWDWGFTLIPESSLTSQVLVGLGLGRDPTSSTNPSENGNPLWITPVGNGETAVTVYVDYNGDNLGALTDPNGNKYDISYDLKALQQQKVYDPDGDQTGMLAYVLTPGVKLAAAWGQDPATASGGNPGLDVGTSVLPLPLFDAGKNGTLSIDNDGNEVISAGDEILYTITINNTSRAPVSSILLKDVFPAHTTYVANSTYFTNELNVTTQIADAGTTAFPLDEGGVIINPLSPLPVGQTYKVTFKVVIDNLANLGGVTTIINKGDATADGVTVPFEDTTPLSFVTLEKEVSADGVTWFDADDPTGPTIAIGQPVYFRVAVTNSGALAAIDVDLSDQIIQGSDTAHDFKFGGNQTTTVAPGATVYSDVISDVALAGQNEDRVSATASVNDGGGPKPIKIQPDDANYFGSQGGVKIVKSVNGDDANSPTGPVVSVGDSLSFTYEVTNTGNSEISNVSVTDNVLGAITSFTGDDDSDGKLDTNETWLYTQSATATAGQVTNTGTVTGTDAANTPVSDDDPANYFGVNSGINVVKKVNGDDANSPTGPVVSVGDSLSFTYEVTNTGNSEISNVSVTDNVLGAITSFTGDDDSDGKLDTNETWLYTQSATATAGQVTNTGTVTGTDAANTPVSDDDPANYFGVNSGINVVKKVNGDDANSPTGPVVSVGDSLSFTYEVTNTGNSEISNVSVTDNVLGAITSFTGDDDSDGKLDTNETWLYTQSATATAGQVTNTGTVTGTDAANTPVSDDDPANYFGVNSGINVVKKVNGDDANSPTGPVVSVGDSLSFTYEVTNTGNSEISNVSVTDNVLGAITSFTGDDDSDGKLDTNETWLYTQSATATAGQVTNTGTVTGTDAANTPVSDDDPANYFGAQSGIRIVKSVNGDDANSPTGPVVSVGDSLSFTYEVTNTGNSEISNVSVTDNVLGAITSFTGDDDSDGKLDTNETWLYTQSATATAGQVTNTGTVTGTDAANTPVSDDDPANYFGAQSGIRIVKSVNGDDANSPTGPVVSVGDSLSFTYEVTNTGNSEISNVSVTDNVLGAITSFTGDDDSDGKLDTNETWLYTQSATATAGQVTNTGTVTGTDAANTPVSDDDPANYFGVNSGINVVKKVNGDDANSPTGPVVSVGDSLSFTYEVTNTGNSEISNVSVTDNVLGAITSFTGDDDSDGKLDTNETWLYTQSATATAGQVTNTGTVTGTDAANTPVSDDDPANYFGVNSGINVVKKVNGDDANSPTGPVVSVGDSLSFTYEVTNTGNSEISNVSVTDNVLGAITSFTGDDDSDGKLDTNETWLYTQSATATAGQVTNTGTVTGTDAANTPVSDDDPANYFGAQSGIRIVKSVNGDDANSPTGPVVSVGDSLSFTYEVTNTGNSEISNVSVTDNVLGAITSFTGDDDSDGKLDTNETWLYTQSATATAGQVTNTGTVTGTDAANTPVSDDDPANYFGVNSGINVVKKVNGDDANSPTGPVVSVGDSLSFTYEVTNTGNSEISNVSVTDNVLGAITSFTGDDDSDGKLDTNETWLYTQSATATAGQVTNTGTVTGTDAANTPVSDDDPANYFGAQSGIRIVKSVNGDDANSPTGPVVSVGDSLSFTYEVTNTGNSEISNVSVTDNVLGAITSFTGMTTATASSTPTRPGSTRSRRRRRRARSPTPARSRVPTRPTPRSATTTRPTTLARSRVSGSSSRSTVTMPTARPVRWSRLATA
jgi:uncharacterized repeat protein (TIGR01451 family)